MSTSHLFTCHQGSQEKGDSDWVGLGQDLRACVSNGLWVDADIAGLLTMLRVARTKMTVHLVAATQIIVMVSRSKQYTFTGLISWTQTYKTKASIIIHL